MGDCDGQIGHDEINLESITRRAAGGQLARNARRRRWMGNFRIGGDFGEDVKAGSDSRRRESCRVNDSCLDAGGGPRNALEPETLGRIRRAT